MYKTLHNKTSTMKTKQRHFTNHMFYLKYITENKNTSTNKKYKHHTIEHCNPYKIEQYNEQTFVTTRNISLHHITLHCFLKKPVMLLCTERAGSLSDAPLATSAHPAKKHCFHLERTQQ